MAGTVNPECAGARPLPAEFLMLGRDLTRELARHLDGCAGCVDEALEIGDVVMARQRTDPRTAGAAGLDHARPAAALRPSGRLGKAPDRTTGRRPGGRRQHESRPSGNRQRMRRRALGGAGIVLLAVVTPLRREAISEIQVEDEHCTVVGRISDSRRRPATV